MAGSGAPVWPRPTCKPDFAACANPLTNGCWKAAGKCAAAVTAWSWSAVANWFWSKAPTTAAPMTDPSWRVVFNTPEAAPAIAGLISRMATVVMGANTSPRPTPVSTKGRKKVIWAEVTVTPDTRIGPRCPYFERCFVTGARRAAADADLVLVNHHLYFADLALRANHPGAKVLPDHDAVIFDEAHQLEDVATEHFGARVSTVRIGP